MWPPALPTCSVYSSWPPAGTCSGALLTTEMSADGPTSTGCELVLSDGSLSFSAAVTLAVLRTVVPAVSKPAFAVIVSATVSGLASVPRSQVTVWSCPAHAPFGVAAETNVRPVGRVSVSWVAVAGEGPAFVTVSVYVASPPAATVAGPVLTTLRSAVGPTWRSADASLSDGSDSGVGELTWATLVCVPRSIPRTVIVTLAVAPFARSPTPHVTTPLASVQSGAPGALETNATPAGSVSVIVTPVAVDGPSLVTVSV